MDQYSTRQLYPKDPKDKAIWLDLLARTGLYPEAAADKIVGVFSADRLVATGARFLNILKMIAVDPDHRGGIAFNTLMETLLSDAFLAGFGKLFLYTKPESVRAFHVLGFHPIVQYEDRMTFMERGYPRIESFLEGLAEKKVAAKNAGAIVMHANPFTNGHLCLIEQALLSSDVVYVFVLSEDRSVISPETRMRLVDEGIRHLNREATRVITLPTADYLVSSATFPSYFTADAETVTLMQAGVDATLFKQKIAPALDIRIRFVGEEPYSVATSLYNRQLAAILNTNPTLTIIPRKEADGLPISASRVRALWQAGKCDELKRLVPPSTYRYLSETPYSEMS